MKALSCPPVFASLRRYFEGDVPFVKNADNSDLLRVVASPANWKFGKRGLTIVFPEYSVSPRAAPSRDVTVSWRSLGPFLVPGSSVPGTSTKEPKADDPETKRNSWRGSYVYEDMEGRNLSGFFMTVDYALQVPDDSSKPVALTMTGYQTDRKVLCTLTGNDERAEIRFLSFADGRVLNEYGVREYESNQLLFSLVRGQGGKGHASLLTEWKALRPSGTRKIAGHYFSASAGVSEASLKSALSAGGSPSCSKRLASNLSSGWNDGGPAAEMESVLRSPEDLARVLSVSLSPNLLKGSMAVSGTTYRFDGLLREEATAAIVGYPSVMTASERLRTLAANGR